MEGVCEVQDLIIDEMGKLIETDGGVLCRVFPQNGQEDIMPVDEEVLSSFGITFERENTQTTEPIATSSDSYTSHKLNDWCDNSTKLLLDKYEEYLPQVGPMKKFKHKKSMWEMISSQIQSSLNVDKSPLQCENRYKTILKRKRNAYANNKTSGSSRIKVDFDDELKKIAAIDDSIEPEIMQSADQCIINPKNQKEKIKKTNTPKETVQEIALRIHREKEENKKKRHEEKMMFLQNFAFLITKNQNKTDET